MLCFTTATPSFIPRVTRPLLRPIGSPTPHHPTLRQCFLTAFRMPPEALAQALPSGLEPDVIHGNAWVCCVMADLSYRRAHTDGRQRWRRLWNVLFGRDGGTHHRYSQIVYRALCRTTAVDGQRGVYTLGSYTNEIGTCVGAALFARERFHLSNIQWHGLHTMASFHDGAAMMFGGGDGREHLWWPGNDGQRHREGRVASSDAHERWVDASLDPRNGHRARWVRHHSNASPKDATWPMEGLKHHRWTSSSRVVGVKMAPRKLMTRGSTSGGRLVVAFDMGTMSEKLPSTSVLSGMNGADGACELLLGPYPSFPSLCGGKGTALSARRFDDFTTHTSSMMAPQENDAWTAMSIHHLQSQRPTPHGVLDGSYRRREAASRYDLVEHSGLFPTHLVERDCSLYLSNLHYQKDPHIHQMQRSIQQEVAFACNGSSIPQQ